VAIDVVVHGVLGRMGQEVLAMASQEPDFSAIGGVDVQAESGELTSPGGNAPIPLTRDLSDVVSAGAVVVDFTNAEGAESAMSTAAPLGANVVVGSTGITEHVMETAGELASRHGVGIVIAPNFALGAVLLTHLTRIAAPFFEYADLTETHHEAKIDAPSGTAISIARAAVEGKGGEFESPAAEKEIIPGTRGGDHEGVVIHSARMPGRVAHHEMVFGALGQTLTLRHDSIDRRSFMPGVAMAIRHVASKPGLVVGLENILGL
jgi:4-hydroxy-tetrahydrodipicolinate reductase